MFRDTRHSEPRGTAASRITRVSTENAMDGTEKIELPDAAIQAYLRLIELNLAGWRPHVAEWLHSEAAEAPLKELLSLVPCSPTLH